MNSTYFKWKWVQDGEVLNENEQRFSTRSDCFTNGFALKQDDSKLQFAKMKITCYDAKTDRAMLEKKVYGSFDMGHGIRIQAVEYDGKPHIDMRIWDTSAEGKGECFYM